jgi:tetratricopeptide (TPR) repeat protein
MSEQQPTLTHLPYFERVGALEDGSAQFRAVSAGLVTLRLFDAWVLEGAHVAAADAWGARAVRESIDAIEAGSSARALLTSIMEAMDARASHARVALVTPRLMAYARLLQLDAEWALAADVYRTVLAHAHPLHDADSVISANLLLGASSRTLARFDEAWEAYENAGEVAAITGDVMSMLKARIGQANVFFNRGNVPEAERILDETISDAEGLGMRELRSIALHDRSLMAHSRGDYDAAIAMPYVALQDARAGSPRDRVLADLAASFFEIGLRSAARDANLVLASTAQEQYTRWQATINLMELAASDGYEPVFEQYRRDLAPAALPPVLEAWYHFYVGQGLRVFDRMEQARASLERALAVAERHGLNQIAYHAEQALGDLKDGVAMVIAASPETTPLVADAADGVRRMRELAGIRN